MISLTVPGADPGPISARRGVLRPRALTPVRRRLSGRGLACAFALLDALLALTIALAVGGQGLFGIAAFRGKTVPQQGGDIFQPGAAGHQVTQFMAAHHQSAVFAVHHAHHGIGRDHAVQSSHHTHFGSIPRVLALCDKY